MPRTSETKRFHGEAFAGNGTVNQPLTRNGRCIVRDCDGHVLIPRITRSGVVASYCVSHLAQAYELFG